LTRSLHATEPVPTVNAAHAATPTRARTVTVERSGHQFARFVVSLLGTVGVIVGVFLSWYRGVDGYRMTYRSLVQTEFGTESDLVKTVGGVALILGVIALLGLFERSGRLTRLAGALTVIVFFLVAAEIFRDSGQQFQTAVRAIEHGLWLELAAGIVLILGGMLGRRG
jgi:hypothetical protein